MKKEFGRLVRASRTAKGMTLFDLSQAAGISIPHLSNIEIGKRGPPPPPVIRKLAGLLDADEGDFLAAATRSTGAMTFQPSTLLHRKVLAGLAREWDDTDKMKELCRFLERKVGAH